MREASSGTRVTADIGRGRSMPAPPDGITGRHLSGGGVGIARGLVPLLLLACLLGTALLGVFGGAPSPVIAARGSAATLAVKAPQILRNGVFFEIRLGIEARQPIAKPVVAISQDYLRDVTLNTQLPEPADMDSEQGLLTMTFPAMKAGDRLEVKLDGQINPSLVGQNKGLIAVRDDRAVLAQVPVALWVFP